MQMLIMEYVDVLSCSPRDALCIQLIQFGVHGSGFPLREKNHVSRNICKIMLSVVVMKISSERICRWPKCKCTLLHIFTASTAHTDWPRSIIYWDQVSLQNHLPKCNNIVFFVSFGIVLFLFSSHSHKNWIFQPSFQNGE